MGADSGAEARPHRQLSFLPLNGEARENLESSPSGSPMAAIGNGTLSRLIRSRSGASLHMLNRRPTSLHITNDVQDREEELGSPNMNTQERRISAVLLGPQMRSQRLIGNSNPRYRWERYWKTEEQLKAIQNKQVRQYYEQTNAAVVRYLYIDRLLDSSLPHDLLNEYNNPPLSWDTSWMNADVPPTISEEPQTSDGSSGAAQQESSISATAKKVRRTPRDIYTVSTENTPLLQSDDDNDEEDQTPKVEIPLLEHDDVESGDHIVIVAIYVNLAANLILLLGKIVVVLLSSSLSVLASFVDAALDFLSTIIVWTTTRLIEKQDQYAYPIGRRRLEPVGVLVFSVIMITSFAQIGLQGIDRLTSGDHTVVELGLPSLIIMLSTVLIKGLCYIWCRLIRNSSVQALAQDAMTDIIFNLFSIIFPLIGWYGNIWWLDSLGGILLSVFVMFNWAKTSMGHIRNLTGAAATADERNLLLYLTMRFAKTIKQIQGLQAYHSGDKLNVEADIVLDPATTNLKDAHDLGESLQYVLESVPFVDRAFVHLDYAGWNLPTHLQQQ